jgi:hypothetical protein
MRRILRQSLEITGVLSKALRSRWILATNKPMAVMWAMGITSTSSASRM